MTAVVVTGGATGIGRATALLAAARGFDVAIATLPDTVSEAKQVTTDVLDLGRRAVTVTTDVTHEIQVERLFDIARTDLGPVTALVNAAGVLYSAECIEIDPVKVDAMMSVNVTGLLLCSREAARTLSTLHGGHGGCIVNISSMAATIGGRHRGVPYAASKAAVDAITTGMAKEVAAEGIRVNAVRPGLVDTALTSTITANPTAREAIEDSIPLGRIGTPAEVAEAVLWLLSDQASWVSGAHLDVSGGGFFVSGSF